MKVIYRVKGLGFKTIESATKYAESIGEEVTKEVIEYAPIKQGLGGYQGQKYTSNGGRVRLK